VRRITKAALGGLAVCALALGGTQVASGALEGTYKYFRHNLVDPLPLFNDAAFDGAKAKTTITETTDGTTFAIRVTGIDPSFPVPDGGFAAHLHVGPCEASAGHYQHVVGTGSDWVNADNEAWFAVVPDEDGMALSKTTVGFVPDDKKYELNVPGKMSIVIHEGPISAPGPKQACFPLDVPQWADPI
jgi:hypothetical protein